MASLLKQHEARIQQITLIPSDGGCFEVTVNGKRIYSKLQTHRHAEPGEIQNLLLSLIKEGG